MVIDHSADPIAMADLVPMVNTIPMENSIHMVYTIPMVNSIHMGYTIPMLDLITKLDPMLKADIFWPLAESFTHY